MTNLSFLISNSLTGLTEISCAQNTLFTRNTQDSSHRVPFAPPEGYRSFPGESKACLSAIEISKTRAMHSCNGPGAPGTNNLRHLSFMA